MYYHRLESIYVFKGKKLKLDISFDNVLQTFEIKKEEEFSDVDKIEITLKMLVTNYSKLKNLTIIEKGELLTKIYNNFIIGESKNTDRKDPRVVDFKQDANYIYASFLSCYGIDLYDVRGILHWKKFVSLFQGLTNDTKIKEIMEIRGRKLRKPTKYNQEEIQNLRELKAYYAIGDIEENYQDGLSGLFNSLERMASK